MSCVEMSYTHICLTGKYRQEEQYPISGSDAQYKEENRQFFF